VVEALCEYVVRGVVRGQRVRFSSAGSGKTEEVGDGVELPT
jgi:hypothetical protein